MNIKMKSKLIIYLGIMLAFLTACSSEKPTHLEPHLATLPASGITRNEATLHGSVSLEGETTLPTLSFKYGETEEMALTSNSINLSDEDSNPSGNGLSTKEVALCMMGLKAGTTYYYMLQGSNGRTTLSSNPMSFTTLPNEKPALNDPQVLSYGPCSIIVGFDITANGGEEITEAGCYYAEDGENAEDAEESGDGDATPTQQKAKIENYQGAIGVQQVKLNDLKFNTTYRIWVYAQNRVGETKSQAITFRTSDAVKLQEAGKLSELMGTHLYEYTQLTIAGDLNGDDLRCLRTMAGRDINNETTEGKLADINLADAHIVAGGGDFGPYHRHTENQVVGQGFLAQCNQLSHILLPSDVTKIEKDAFAGCTSLKEIEIPASVSQLLPSAGCTALESIQVSKANTHYSSQDGVLFNAAGTEILWFPMGKKGDYTLPSTLSGIGDYAFKESSITRFIFPDSFSEIGQGVLMNSQVEEISLPAQLKLIPTGTFQGCTRLKVVRLGEKTELVSDYVFDGCPLTDLYVDAPYPPVCNTNAFTTKGTPFLPTCVLHVPAGKKKLYQNNRSWSKFEHIVEQ